MGVIYLDHHLETSLGPELLFKSSGESIELVHSQLTAIAAPERVI